MLDSPEHFAESMAVMVAGPYMLVNACAPAMKAAGYGRIVNVSSGWGSFAEGLGGPSAYGVAKAALNALTLALSRELPAPVKINATCPGWVRTRMGGAGATLSPEEGADTAIWLATLPDDGPTGGLFRQRKKIPWYPAHMADRVREHFFQQADVCKAMGSPFTAAAVCRLASASFNRSTPTRWRYACAAVSMRWCWKRPTGVWSITTRHMPIRNGCRRS